MATARFGGQVAREDKERLWKSSPRTYSSRSEAGEETQPADAAVGKDAQTRVRRLACRQQILIEAVECMRLERRARQELPPCAAFGHETLDRLFRNVCHVDRTAPRSVALEVCRVHFGAANGARASQAQDCPIMTRPPPTPGFPAIAHVAAAARQDQVVAGPEEHVARRENEPAVLDRREIHFASRSGESVPVRE